MVPNIRNILGGFLFSGDDVDKPVRVLSGGERTRLAVARMLLRPSNTLLLDEPTNHLDLDSKDVLLEALEDFGGTLIFVSHDRYFVDKLATKIVEIGGGGALVYPGTYEEFLWSRKQREAAAEQRAGPSRRRSHAVRASRPPRRPPRPPAVTARPAARRSQSSATGSLRGTQTARGGGAARAQGRRRAAAANRRAREPNRRTRTGDQGPRGHHVGSRVLRHHEKAKPVVDRHQALMWEVGDLMSQWEALQQDSERSQ